MKVVVVGAGVLGSAMALRLARAGCQVTICERDHPGGGASGRSFAWLNARNKDPEAYFHLSVEAMHAYSRLARDLGRAEWWHRTGSLQLAAMQSDPDQTLERMKAVGLEVRRIGRARALALEPDLMLSPGEDEFLFYEGDSFVEVLPAIAAQLAAATALGATIRIGSDVQHIEVAGGRVSGVRLASGDRIPADAVAVAAGVETPSLVGEVAHPPQLVASDAVAIPGRRQPRGVLAVTDQVCAAVERVVHLPDVHFRPDGGGRLVLQASAVEDHVPPGTVVPPGSTESNELLRRGRGRIRYLDHVEVVQVRQACRPMPVDGLPAVGRYEEPAGLYVAVTHSGVTLAALLSEIATAEIAHEHESELLSAFRPQRFDASRQPHKEVTSA
jgi:glycine/D-amino acid oxidase-like deaminating enzyme